MPDADQSLSSLQFSAVRGTSAKSPFQFAAVDNKLAYLAGGGVVVSTIGPDGEVKSQRYFVANNLSDFTPSGHSYASYHLFSDNPLDTDTKRDIYGYPVSQTPITYERSVGDNADLPRLGLMKNDHKDVSGAPLPAKSKIRVRAVSCLALAPNGRVLAVGEAGYRPRILLFSLAPDSSGSPFAIIYEHSFEVKSIAFSPDLRSFCSLGNLADGFLYIWKYTPHSITLRAGNKCSSVVNALLWHDSGSGDGHIVTAGLRFLKVWSCETAAQGVLRLAVLKGRNVVLGKYLDQNLQEVVSINPDEVLVRGNNILFVLLIRGGSLKFVPVAHRPSGLYGLLVNYEEHKVWYFNEELTPQVMELANLEPISESFLDSTMASPLKSSPVILSMSPNRETEVGPVVKAYQWESGLIYLSQTEQIVMYNAASNTSRIIMGPKTASIAGGKKATGGKLVFFSTNGDIYTLLKNEDLKLVHSHNLVLSDVIANEMTAIELVDDKVFLGDKYGQLSILDNSAKEPVSSLTIKAHSSTINDIVYFEVGEVKMLCSISRDRMIQLYYQNDDTWELMRTLPTHNGNLIAASFANSCLFVCSADRTVSVHEIVEDGQLHDGEPVSVYQKKILTLKTTPLAMEVSESSLIISTNDKCLLIYDSGTLEFKRSLKLFSEETNDSLCVEKFTVLPRNYIAVSSTDKSLRVFHLISGKHVCVVWGHSDTILGLFEENSVLTSIGSDGCLFEWTLLHDANASISKLDNRSRESTPDSSPLYAKVTRKILPTPLLSAQSSPRKSLIVTTTDSIPEAESPTRRLTSATLRRLEAKKKSTESPTRPASLSRSPSKEPFSRESSPKKSTTSSSAMSAKLNLSRQPSPARSIRSDSPIKAKSIHASQSSRLSVSKDSPVLTPPSPTNHNDAMERSTAYLAMIKALAQKGHFTEQNKGILKQDLEEILSLLGGSNYTEILEKYSTELTELVKKKLKD